MNSKERAHLRGLANTIDSIFQVGKKGISNNLIKQLDDALEARELIKLHVLENSPEDIIETSKNIASLTNSEIIQIVGNKLTLFRKKKENSKIEFSK